MQYCFICVMAFLEIISFDPFLLFDLIKNAQIYFQRLQHINVLGDHACFRDYSWPLWPPGESLTRPLRIYPTLPPHLGIFLFRLSMFVPPKYQDFQS